MKIGMRKPNFKARIKARTTGKLKRKIKRSINPLYGKKGVGIITNPKKAIYNKIYNKTTFTPISKKGNETLIHLVLFFCTAGIGNIIYMICKKK